MYGKLAQAQFHVSCFKLVILENLGLLIVCSLFLATPNM
jgi:hypothetical protein